MSDNQRNVAIFIFDDVEVLDFAGPFEVFNVTGEVIDPAPFNTHTVALNEEPIKARGNLSIHPHYSIICNRIGMYCPLVHNSHYPGL